ncbi:Ig-like domain-containing protein [Sphingomonas sp. I4]
MTAPSAPTATVNGQGTTITGTGEPGATVTVRDASGQPLGSTTVGSNGNYTLPLTTPQANGGTLTVTQVDPAGNVSPAAIINAPTPRRRSPRPRRSRATVRPSPAPVSPARPSRSAMRAGRSWVRRRSLPTAAIA